MGIGGITPAMKLEMAAQVLRPRPTKTGRITADHRAGFAATFDQCHPLPRNTPARDQRVRDCSQALTGDVIDDVEHPEPPRAG